MHEANSSETIKNALTARLQQLGHQIRVLNQVVRYTFFVALLLWLAADIASTANSVLARPAWLLLWTDLIALAGSVFIGFILTMRKTPLKQWRS
jgi:hypothetical protein